MRADENENSQHGGTSGPSRGKWVNTDVERAGAERPSVRLALKEQLLLESLGLKQSFSTKGDFAPQGTLNYIWRHFGLSQFGRESTTAEVEKACTKELLQLKLWF